MSLKEIRCPYNAFHRPMDVAIDNVFGTKLVGNTNREFDPDGQANALNRIIHWLRIGKLC